MKTLLRLSKLVAALFPIMLLAILFGTLGFFCAISIPVLGTIALFSTFPLSYLFFIGILRGILHYAEQYCNHFIAFTLLAKIRNIVFSKLRSLGPAKLEGREKGNLISLITSDIELLEVFYAHTISPVCIAFLVGLGMFFFLKRLHWAFAIIATIYYLAVSVVIPLIVRKKATIAGEKHRNEFAKMNSFLLDCLRGIQQSITYATGKIKLSEIQKKSDELSKSQKEMSKTSGSTTAFTALFVGLAAISMLAMALHLYIFKVVNFQTALTAIVMFSSFGPFIALANLGSGLSQTIAAGKRVLSLLDEEATIKDITNKQNVTFKGAKCENISFSYPTKDISNDEIILNNLSLDFPEKTIIGLQGKSGSGKSTILKILMRFWKAQKGITSISGISLEDINTSNLRDLENYVTQETILFHDTIENNIKIAKLDATEKEVKEACRKAAIADFIENLPNGYKTQVTELGDNFSGGERQRLGLARAFLHNGDFMLLDEPTSNLDSFNEKEIMQAVKNESKDKTVVIVSHRASTLSIADKIYKIESLRKS